MTLCSVDTFVNIDIAMSEKKHGHIEKMQLKQNEELTKIVASFIKWGIDLNIQKLQWGIFFAVLLAKNCEKVPHLHAHVNV